MKRGKNGELLSTYSIIERTKEERNQKKKKGRGGGEG